MKNVRFYAEFKSSYMKRKRLNPIAVVAVCTDDRKGDMNGAVCNALDGHDSPCYTQVSDAWLRRKCTRITVDEARRIQPSVVKYMEQD